MRQKHFKFHAIALGIICLVVVVAFLLFGPKEAGPAEEVIGDRYIQVATATWGKNCDPFVAQAQRDWRMPAEGQTAEPRPSFAQLNNVIEVVKSQCEHKMNCRLLADTDLLKTDPLPACYKKLAVGYRCFEFDRLWNVETGQGEILELDCHETAPKAGQ